MDEKKEFMVILENTETDYRRTQLTDLVSERTVMLPIGLCSDEDGVMFTREGALKLRERLAKQHCWEGCRYHVVRMMGLEDVVPSPDQGLVDELRASLEVSSQQLYRANKAAHKSEYLWEMLRNELFNMESKNSNCVSPSLLLSFMAAKEQLQTLLEED